MPQGGILVSKRPDGRHSIGCGGVVQSPKAGDRMLGDRQAAGHDPPDGEGKVVCRPRLGGVLRHYERRRAA